MLQAMVKMNKVVNVPALTKIMQDFARENEKSDMMGEMLGDAMDDAMAEGDDEEEQERIVSQVLDELGLKMGEQVRCDFNVWEGKGQRRGRGGAEGVASDACSGCHHGPWPPIDTSARGLGLVCTPQSSLHECTDCMNSWWCPDAMAERE